IPGTAHRPRHVELHRRDRRGARHDAEEDLAQPERVPRQGIRLLDLLAGDEGTCHHSPPVGSGGCRGFPTTTLAAMWGREVATRPEFRSFLQFSQWSERWTVVAVCAGTTISAHGRALRPHLRRRY